MTPTRTSNTGFLCLSLLLAAACGDSSPKPATSSNGVAGVTDAYARFKTALADCGANASQCAQDAHGDGIALQGCRDQLASCRESAGRNASNALASAIHGCVDTMKKCQQSAKDPAAHTACSDNLQACLGANGGNEDDAGTDTDAGAARSPVGACADKLRACVTADNSAELCADQLRACVLTGTPAPDDVLDHGDHTAPDAGMSGPPPQTQADAGTPAGGMPADAGKPSAMPEPKPDAGMPKADCAAQYDACLKGNGTRQGCSQARRACEKSNGG